MRGNSDLNTITKLKNLTTMFENSEQSSLLIAGLIGLIVWLFIVYNIIKSASQSDKVVHYLTLQTALLIKMLKKSGASDEEIEEVISSAIPQKKTS